MYKLVIFAAVLALAVAAPAGPPAATVLTYAAPVAVATHVAAPIAYAAHAIPAPVAYHTGYEVSYEVEPVEQHGYSVKY